MAKRKPTELSPLDLRDTVLRNVKKHGSICKTQLAAMNQTINDYGINFITLFGMGLGDHSHDTLQAYGLPTNKGGNYKSVISYGRTMINDILPDGWITNMRRDAISRTCKILLKQMNNI